MFKNYYLILWACLVFQNISAMGVSETESYDVVIYGPTSAGVAAAVQAVRMEKSVVIVGPDKHLGGLSAGGLGWTDSGNKAVIGGISREFYQRVKAYYDDPKTWKYQKPEQYGRYDPKSDAQWTFAPSIAEQVFEDLVQEYKIPVHRDEWLDREQGVKKEDGKIVSITMLSGKTYRGKMFIDATYEGDLMAAAGVSYTVGREANSQYNESLNGIQPGRKSHQFENNISPYVVPGDPASGLVPRVHAGGPGEKGEGDHRVQAYNYRCCLTQVKENRVPFPKPKGYDPYQYELLLRDLKAGSRHVFGKFDMLPDLKTDTNNHGSFSTDNIGMNYDYPEAGYERRAEILEEHTTYQQGYWYFICNDPRVPRDVQQRMRLWGLAKDEFVDNGHWPHQIYVREARRMVSDFVVYENILKRIDPSPRPVGMGSYNMDSHNVQRYVDEDGFVRNEGDVQVNPGGPYPIDYGAIVPKKKECNNLLVPVAVSASHIAYGSIRMEPVFMILGQSAATAAVMAMDEGIAVQDVPYGPLRERLLADKQVLEYEGDASRLMSKRMKGIVIDNKQAKLVGQWSSSSANHPFVDGGYQHDGAKGNGNAMARFEAALPKAGGYEVRLYYPANSNRATNVPVRIISGSDDTIVQVNQRKKPKDGYVELGTYSFEEKAVVQISNRDTDGHVIIDAVQFVPAR